MVNLIMTHPHSYKNFYAAVKKRNEQALQLLMQKDVQDILSRKKQHVGQCVLYAIIYL